MRKAFDEGVLEELPSEPARLSLVPFDNIVLGTERRYLVKGLIPIPGLSVIWGAPKSGKSFWTFDLVMHVALGWEYRGRRVHQGPVIYCCFEGQSGVRARVEAFRQRYSDKLTEEVPFFLQPVTLDLVRDHPELIEAVRAKLREAKPVAIVLDTLNRSLTGSESNDTDMSNYVRAADAIRDAFDCSVLIVHHCGHKDNRPRGHSSLTGAVDAQLAVKRHITGIILVTAEFMKDGDAGECVASHLESMEVGRDQDGELITSCVVVEAEAGAAEERPKQKKSLSSTAQIVLKALEKSLIEAGAVPPTCNHVPRDVPTVSVDLWRRYAYQSGISSGEDRAKQQAFKRAHDTLVAKELVGAWGDDRWLVT